MYLDLTWSCSVRGQVEPGSRQGGDRSIYHKPVRSPLIGRVGSRDPDTGLSLVERNICIIKQAALRAASTFLSCSLWNSQQTTNTNHNHFFYLLFVQNNLLSCSLISKKVLFVWSLSHINWAFASQIIVLGFLNINNLNTEMLSLFTGIKVNNNI